MGNIVKWPRKPNNSNPKRDTTKLCEFHAENSYSTPNCIALHLEVANLLKKGHLQNLLFDKGKSTFSLRENHQANQPATPTLDKTMKVITGSLEVSGITNSAAHQGGSQPEN